jgi:hypothetical protein
VRHLDRLEQVCVPGPYLDLARGSRVLLADAQEDVRFVDTARPSNNSLGQTREHPISICTEMHSELRKPDMARWQHRSARASAERRVRTCARSSCSGPIRYRRVGRTEGTHPCALTQDLIEIRIP